jgi:hypothetical protein
MQQGTINVQTENIFPIIKKFLYSDHEIFLRELVSNAVDATQKLKTLTSLGEFKGELGELRVDVVLNKEEKAALKKETPGKSESWYKNKEREFRKNRTIRLVNIEFMTNVDDNDVADAIAIGWYATNNWNKISKLDL